MSLLIDLLQDREEKTRANAAGALGNFVRNSNTLIPDLIEYGALYRLVEIISDKKSTSLSPRRIALFSIGNLCAYPECRKVFEDLNVREIVKKFSVRVFNSSDLFFNSIPIVRTIR